MVMKKLLTKAFWLLVTLAGLYLVFIEVGMAISEFHALRGTNILFFAVLVALGLFLCVLGLSKLCRKPVGQSSE
jgi:hypothetical protein